MLGVSGMMGSTGDGAASGGTQGGHESGGGSGETGMVGEEEKLVMRIDEGGGERSSGGNRWPRQETVALLKIRSEMDAVFKDSSLKGHLWEEVSRKMGELGYHRNARKCKEKFENVFKYHKRTKEGRASKPESKTYRFFDQLEALDAHPPALSSHPRGPTPTFSLPLPPTNTNNNSSSLSPMNASPITTLTTLMPPNANAAAAAANLAAQQAPGIGNFGSVSTSSSSTSSDEEDIERRRSRKKRKWELFFQRLMKDVMEKQEAMQKKFLETLEKRERDRVAREESWRVMEMARINREHDILVQERSAAAAKDAAVIAFLQKVSDQQLPIPPFPIPNSAPPIQMQIQIQPQPQPKPQETTTSNAAATAIRPPLPPILLPPPAAADIPNSDNGNESLTPASSSRWPKAEVQALIGLRTNMDLKYQDNGPKGPLWEEISSSMKKLGYNRNAKRCKEKWENINKYFKKVKESNKRRPEDSKTCPYFHQLDAIYRERSSSKLELTPSPFPNPNSTNQQQQNPMLPIMVQPEQQWPLHPAPPQRHQLPMADHDSDNAEDDEDMDDDDHDDDDDDDDAAGYEIVTNKPPPSSVGTVE